MWSFHENEKILDLIQRSELGVELEVPTVEDAYLIWRNFDKVDWQETRSTSTNSHYDIRSYFTTYNLLIYVKYNLTSYCSWAYTNQIYFNPAIQIEVMKYTICTPSRTKIVCNSCCNCHAPWNIQLLPLGWEPFKCTLFSIQKRYCNLTTWTSDVKECGGVI